MVKEHHSRKIISLRNKYEGGNEVIITFFSFSKNSTWNLPLQSILILIIALNLDRI